MIHTSKEEYNYILTKMEKDITSRQIIGEHKIINAKTRLALKLRFLAIGETYQSLCFQCRISRAAISYIIDQVSKPIRTHLAEYIAVPTAKREWLAICTKLGERWVYPNCVGTVDGKHIAMQPPPNAGSKFITTNTLIFNVPMGVAGLDYECIYADIGTDIGINGRVSGWESGINVHFQQNRYWGASTACTKLLPSE